MKIKNLFTLTALVSISIVSCTKTDISIPQVQESTQSTNTVQSSVSRETSTNTAYIFIEPVSKVQMVSKFLKDSVVRSQGTPFLGFAFGFGITNSNKNDLLNYMDLKYFYNGQLPAVIQTEVPQVSGGVDQYGNQIIAHNFKAVRINNSQIGGTAWVTVFIPTSAMANDTKRQVRIQASGTGISTTTITQNPTIYSYTLNYTGNRLPKTTYRVYTTFVSSAMRFPFQTNGFTQLRGLSN